MWKHDEKKEILLQVIVLLYINVKKYEKKKKYCYKSRWLQGILRLWSIIHETRAYQDSDQSFARLGHIKIPINHLQDIGMSVLRLIIRRTWTYQDTINHLQEFGHIKTDRSVIRTAWAYEDSNKSSQVIGISVLYLSFARLGHIN